MKEYLGSDIYVNETSYKGSIILTGVYKSGCERVILNLEQFDQLTKYVQKMKTKQKEDK